MFAVGSFATGGTDMIIGSGTVDPAIVLGMGSGVAIGRGRGEGTGCTDSGDGTAG
jgi:hypothetical protein